MSSIPPQKRSRLDYMPHKVVYMHHAISERAKYCGAKSYTDNLHRECNNYGRTIHWMAAMIATVIKEFQATLSGGRALSFPLTMYVMSKSVVISVISLSTLFQCLN